MSHPNRAGLLGFFVAVIVAICGVQLAKGGLYLGKHEGDTFHLLQIVMRMADGEWPHLDFITPIGALAFWPIVAFVKAGFGIGLAIILGQALMAVVMLPAIWWVAVSRMRGLASVLFGAFIIILITALVHGEAERSVSISMHYNRWAWALSFLVILAALAPSATGSRPWVDGAIVGAGLFALGMIKVTYFGAFVIPVALALYLRGEVRALGLALVTGLALMLVVTLFAGPAFWLKYLGDLLAVAGSDIRPFPSEPLGAVLGAPAYLGGSLTLFAGVIFLRQGRQDVPGLVLLLLAPVFFYVTYQNYANDPQWLMLLGVLLLVCLPEDGITNGFGWDMRRAVQITAAIALALSAPSYFNMGYSSFRHYFFNEDKYVPFFAQSEQHDDLYAARIRAWRADQRGPLDISGTGLEDYADIEEAIEATVFRGETLPICSLELGMIAWFQTIVDDLEATGFAGPDKRLLAADLFSSHWLFGDFQPLQGGAPWYYGGLPGVRSADYLLVPLCPVIHEVRNSILEDVEAGPFELEELRRTKLYVLYSIRLIEDADG